MSNAGARAEDEGEDDGNDVRGRRRRDGSAALDVARARRTRGARREGRAAPLHAELATMARQLNRRGTEAKGLKAIGRGGGARHAVPSADEGDARVEGVDAGATAQPRVSATRRASRR